jgi:hypothetical protein
VSVKADKIEIVQRINRATKRAGLPDIPSEMLRKADAITLNLFYNRWLSVTLGKLLGGPSQSYDEKGQKT